MGKFLHEQRVYARVYDQSDRTIKRWIKTGRAALGGEDLPPLDNPVRMVSWWAKHYKHKAPDGIIQAAARHMESSEKEIPISEDGEEESETNLGNGNGISREEVGTGFSGMIERVKMAEAAAYRKYNDALQAGDEGRLQGARRVWGELSKQLRELERDSHQILSKSGAVVDRSVVERMLAEMHGPIVQGIRSMWRRVKSRMRTAASDQEEDKIWQDECDRLLFRLNESEFREFSA